MILFFTVDKQIITRRDNEKVVRDSQNYLYINFSFSEDWTGTKTAVFKGKSGNAFNVLIDENGSCLVPWEVLTEEYFEVSAFCGDLITANVVKVFTIESGYTIGEESRTPTPDIYAQIIARLSAIEAEIDPTAIQQIVDEYLSDKDYVTEQDVEQIVADYIEAHKDELKGEKGDTGATGPTGPQGPKGDTGEGVAPGGTTGQVLIKSSNADYDTEWGNAGTNNILGLKEHEVYTPVEVTPITGHFVRMSNGTIGDSNNTAYMEVSVTAGEKYAVTSSHSYSIAVYALYDSNGVFVSAYPTVTVTETVIESATITIPDGVTMLRCSGNTNAPLALYRITSDGYVVDNTDVLNGKKWFACGDSFTAGDFNGYTDGDGKTGAFSDAFDPVEGVWKTYPYWIKKRTGINADWRTCARGGIDFTNVTGATQPFSSDTATKNYTMIPSDCDYITLQFGLNELDLTTEQIGTSADTTNETLWGAYNVVLTSILTANPRAKIGIIVSDAWMCDNTTYYDALIDIAEYWGIPYLDLSGGDFGTPMMINRRGTVSAFAKETRTNAMAINYPSNPHPTPEGHKYRSTVIENFLRSL